MQIDVQALIDERIGNKKVFLDNVQEKINTHIAGKSWQECLTIVQLNSDGTINSTWSPDVSSDYAGRLLPFMRGERYRGDMFFSFSTEYYDLDSGLTKGVVDVVTDEFKKFYSSEEFSNLLFQQLMKDQVFAGELASKLADILNEASNGVLGSALKQQLSDQLSQSLLNAERHILAPTIGSALKAVLGQVITATAAKAGVSSFGCTVAPILIFAIAWIVNREAKNLLADMGKKVSKAVCDELDGRFAIINNIVVTEMARSLARTGMSDLVGKIAGGLMENENFKKAVGDLK